MLFKKNFLIFFCWISLIHAEEEATKQWIDPLRNTFLDESTGTLISISPIACENTPEVLVQTLHILVVDDEIRPSLLCNNETPLVFSCYELTPIEGGLLEGKIGYFYPFSSTLREIVGGGANYQLSLTYPIWKRISLFTSVDFFNKEGRSTGDHSRTSFWLLPFTLGLKVFTPVYQSCNPLHHLNLYFALGPRYYISRAINHASYVDHSNTAQGFGGMGSVGAVYSYNSWTITAFIDASFAQIRSHTSITNVKTPRTQVGGLVSGGGIGYNF